MNVSSESKTRATKAAWIIFAAALVVRLALAFWLPQEVIWPDGKRYEKVALSLIHGEGFGDLVQNRLSVPTQPLLIAGVYSVFGEKNYLALRVVSAVIGAVSVLLGFLLTRSLFGTVAAICAGVMLAGYPYLVYLSALFEYPQPLFILLMAGFFLLHQRFLISRSLLTLFCACLCLGIGVLTVPTALLFVPILGLLLLTRRPLESALRIGVLAAALLLTVGSWATRNYVAYGQMVLINAASGWNFWVANNETYARYGKEGVVPPCAPGYERTDYCRDYRTLNASVRAKGLEGVERVREEERLAWEYGLDYLHDHPQEFAVLAVQKFLRLWSPVPDAVTKGRAQGGSARDAIGAATYIPLLLFGLAGMVLAAKEHWRKLLPMYAFILIFVAPFAIFLPTTRYRLPIDFLFAVFASYALLRAWAFSFRWRTRDKLLQVA
ncbi:MAG: glycosyltransferase family 39 protein [Steroidobacteraceae bacterium]